MKHLHTTILFGILLTAVMVLAYPSPANAITADEVLGEFRGLQATAGDCSQVPAGEERQRCERNRRVGQAACLSQDFLNTIDSAYRGWNNELANLANQALREAFTQIGSYAKCLIGGVLGLGSGTITGNRCTEELSSNLKQYYKKDLKKELVDDVKARAMARCLMDQASDQVRRVINENGREGGPAWVEDYNDLYGDAKTRGEAAARNNFANTKYCPWLQRDMEALFGFSPEQARPTDQNVDGGTEPYSQRAACSFPDGVTSNQIAANPESTYLLALPQNNITGAYLLAQSHMREMVELQIKADETQVIANNGYFGVEECVERNEQGTCLRWRVKTPGSQLNTAEQAAVQAEFDWISQSKEQNDLLADTTARITNRLIDSTLVSLETELEVDPSTFDTGTAQDPPPPPPVGVDPGDPGSAGGAGCGLPAASCTCWADATDPDFAQRQALAVQILGETLGKVARQQAGVLTTPDAQRVISRDLWVPFIEAVCFELGSAFRNCRAYVPRADDVIIVPLNGGTVDLFVDIIRGSDGGIRNPGMMAKYTCPAGVVP
ncbi:MAG TPA: hypothetical protein VD862_01375 [Candidatus Paceibacterota bacterium]|nr:hypothetical protein [Candidatus Paceibacterota bacterium]